jgi:hypothetical protein
MKSLKSKRDMPVNGGFEIEHYFFMLVLKKKDKMFSY